MAQRERSSIPATLTTQVYPGTAPRGSQEEGTYSQTRKLRLWERKQLVESGFTLSLPESESQTLSTSSPATYRATQTRPHLGTCQRKSRSLQEGRGGSPPRPHGNAARKQEPKEPGSP